MEFKPDATTYKLILLYMLDKMEIPLTENSILEICSTQNDWINWMECKDILAQLIKAEFIYKPSTDNDEDRYNITIKGRECVSQFYSRIPKSLRDNIDQFVVDNKLYFKRSQEYVSKYFKNEDGSYTVELRILEPNIAQNVFALSIKADSRHAAMMSCKKWKDIAPSVYQYIYSKVIEN